MRKEFFLELFEYMKTDERIMILTGDLGYGLLDQIRQEYPDRFINCGAAEQTMLDVAVGMTYEGKIPFVYSITPFLLYRPFETLRTYVNHEKLHMVLVGSGRDLDYHEDGFTHHATDDKLIMRDLPNINCLWPETGSNMKQIIYDVLKFKRPSYINLTRK